MEHLWQLKAQIYHRTNHGAKHLGDRATATNAKEPDNAEGAHDARRRSGAR